jgi:hypothetical protein
MQKSAADVEQAVDDDLMQDARPELERLQTECDRVLHELEAEHARSAA